MSDETFKPFWQLVHNEESGNNDLYIMDEIAREQSWAGDEVTPKQFRQELSQMKGDVSVWIDSPGGDAFAGCSIYEELRRYSVSGKGKVRAYITGLAASAAGLIAMAADEVYIGATATFMLHDPWSSLSGNATALRKQAVILDEIRESYINAYVRKTGSSREHIKELMDGDGTYMNARRAVQEHFADELIYDDEIAAQQLNQNRVYACERWTGLNYALLNDKLAKAALDEQMQQRGLTWGNADIVDNESFRRIYENWISEYYPYLAADMHEMLYHKPGGDKIEAHLRGDKERDQVARELLRACASSYDIDTDWRR